MTNLKQTENRQQQAGMQHELSKHLTILLTIFASISERTLCIFYAKSISLQN